MCTRNAPDLPQRFLSSHGEHLSEHQIDEIEENQADAGDCNDSGDGADEASASVERGKDEGRWRGFSFFLFLEENFLLEGERAFHDVTAVGADKAVPGVAFFGPEYLLTLGASEKRFHGSFSRFRALRWRKRKKLNTK